MPAVGCLVTTQLDDMQRQPTLQVSDHAQQARHTQGRMARLGSVEPPPRSSTPSGGPDLHTKFEQLRNTSQQEHWGCIICSSLIIPTAFILQSMDVHVCPADCSCCPNQSVGGYKHRSAHSWALQCVGSRNDQQNCSFMGCLLKECSR